jgi:3-oxoacyl-[acyl-carrier-protein] synthase-1
MNPLSVSHYSLVSAVGHGREATLAAFRSRRSGLRPCDFLDYHLETYIGRVEGVEQSPIVGDLAHFDCRNNRLAAMALRADGFAARVAEARARYGAERIAVILGTSTSGILESELAYRRRSPDDGRLPGDFNYRYVHNTFSVADFTRHFLALRGPASAISTACSSSAKAFATASRFIDAGICDAAVVGGVDSLCGTTLYGFHALQLVSPRPCRPADPERDGISIGEAAGFALLEKASSGSGAVRLLGYGESSDAYHMSSPHPEGAGAARSMSRALQRGAVAPEFIDHVLLHGTGTVANDAAEDRALQRVFPSPPGCSSIKGWTGHTLGAAGIVNAVAACLSLEARFIPGTLQSRSIDSALGCPVLLENRSASVRCVLSNSFGFGGNNASLIFSRVTW